MRIIVVFFKYQFFLENGYIEFFTSKLGYVSLQNPKNFQMFELPSNFRVKDFLPALNSRTIFEYDLLSAVHSALLYAFPLKCIQ